MKSKLAALAASVKGLLKGELQSGGARATGQTMNYLSVTTVNPGTLARAFASADTGVITEQARLFELIEEQDPHIYAELAKRRRGVTSLDWHLSPPDDASEAEIARAKELEDIIRKIQNVEDTFYDLTDGIGKGLVALEIKWKTGSLWVPERFDFVPQRFMQVDRTTGGMQYLNMGIPEPLRPGGWVIHEHRAKSGWLEQSALFRVLAWTYAYKSYDTFDMQRFLELYGIPLRLGKYPDGIGKPRRDELLKAVRNIGNDGAGIVPTSMAIEFINAQAGKVDDFLSAIQYWESKQSKAILGGDLDGKTTTEARIMLYDKVRREIMLHDVSQLQPTINRQIITPIALFNGMFAEDRMPAFIYDTAETVDQQALINVLEKASSLGMEIDVDWAHTALQIPRADKDAISLGKPANGNAALARLVALAKAKQTTGDITTAYADQLAALCVPHEQKLINKINAAISDAGDFESAIEAIAQLSLQPVDKAWGDDVGLGLLAANLAGRNDGA